MSFAKLQTILLIVVLAFWAIDEIGFNQWVGPQWVRPIIVTILFVSMAARIWRGSRA